MIKRVAIEMDQDQTSAESSIRHEPSVSPFQGPQSNGQLPDNLHCSYTNPNEPEMAFGIIRFRPTQR